MTQYGDMRNARAASEHEVILAFLRGEFDSSRFGPAIHAALGRAGGSALVMNPDLRSHRENEARRTALAEARGWGLDEGLFAGFPSDVTWQHGLLDVGELERLRFIEYSYWVELSGGSRRPADVRRMLESPERLPPWLVEMGLERPFELADVIGRKGVPGELVVVGTADLNELVVLEGHARLTALFVGGLHEQVPVTAYVGTSKHIRNWRLF